MKKWFVTAMFAACILVMISTPAAAGNIQIKIDGVPATTDVTPDIKQNRTMVPLRVISENLGATVHWSNSTVTLSNNDMKIILKPNSHTATKNGKAILLDSKPYLKHNRTMVPLRFIAEAFGSTVSYSDSTVTVMTEPLRIDGVKVKAVQQEYRMTMGGVVQQIKGNAYNKAIYQAFIENKGSKVEAPDNYSWQYNMDIPGAYYKNGQYDFLDSEGTSIKRFDIYTLVKAFPDEALAGYPDALIYDAAEDQWYVFSTSAIQSIDQFINTASNNGYLHIISNTVV